MLQDDLNRLYEWSEKWQVQFNVNKCSIMSKGYRPVDYTLNDTTLVRSYSVRDLGVQVSSDLRPREQCIKARNRANKILRCIIMCDKEEF